MTYNVWRHNRRKRERTGHAVTQMTCNAESETGRVCEMQRDHGGEMHCGGDPLKWWDRDGTMVDFAAASPREQTR